MKTFLVQAVILLVSLVSGGDAAPAVPPYNQQNAAYAYYYAQPTYNPQLSPEQNLQNFRAQWQQLWDKLQTGTYGLQGTFGVLTGDKLPGVNGAWSFLVGSGSNPSSLSSAGANSLAGYNQNINSNTNSASNFNSASNSLSNANALSNTNSNAGYMYSQTSYNQQAALSTSGSNSNQGTNIHQGTNTHSGTNTGPTNYNGPISGSSSTVNAPTKKPVFIQGAVSNVGNAGSILVP